MSKYLDDLENWMGNLPDQLKNISVIHLAIPGSHNTMTYGITRKSALAPDAEKSIRNINKVFPCIVRRWAITQKMDVTQQLMSGVRFFDLRIVAKDLKFYFSHALFSFEINQALWQIRVFLEQHPKEFVILDFQHFYNFQETDHDLLHLKIRTIFSYKMYERKNGSLLNCTLNNAERLTKQVIVIYRKHDTPSDMWPADYWPTPWPNTDNIRKLKEFLEKSLENRQSDEGFVTQCIITPTTKYILPRFFLSLKTAANQVDKKLSNWIKEQRPGPFKYGEDPRVNVFLGDFVHIKQNQFCRLVIGLNQHLECYN